jgi:hypothetical protein
MFFAKQKEPSLMFFVDVFCQYPAGQNIKNKRQELNVLWRIFKPGRCGGC